MRIGFFHSIVRKDEKLLLQALQRRPEVDVTLLDERDITFRPAHDRFELDGVLLRSISHNANLAAAALFESAGVPCLNHQDTIRTCGDKLLTSLALARHNVSQPDLRVAFDSTSALHAIEQMGYPVVLKPLVGSWGRLIGRINDRDAAESVLEHKERMGGPAHSTTYIQKFVPKNGRDIRTFVVGDDCVAAIYRTGAHWKTNTALGAVVAPCPVTGVLADASLRAARAVGGGVVAVDLFETESGPLVNEVNHTMEFKNSIEPTGVDIPACIASYAVKQFRRGSQTAGVAHA